MALMSDLAWLAGFWDGEGSIGLVQNKNTKVLTCQLSSTCRFTIVEILSILERHAINGRGYTYQERDPDKHKDAHYIRVTGMGNVLKFAELLLPFAVTKKRHWEIAIEWSKSRIAKAGGLNEKGHLIKRGIPIPYDEKELALFDELCSINRRGPIANHIAKRGRIDV